MSTRVCAFLVMASFGSGASLSMTAQDVDDLKRGPEFALELYNKHSSGAALSAVELTFAGFETIRGLHLAFDYYWQKLSSPNYSSELMAQIVKDTAPAVKTEGSITAPSEPLSVASSAVAEQPSVYSTLIRPLVESTQSLLSVTEGSYPTHLGKSAEMVVFMAYQKMLTIMELDLSVVKGSQALIKKLLLTAKNRNEQIALAQVHATMLMQLYTMAESLALITRNTASAKLLLDAVIDAALGSLNGIKAVVGSNESQQMEQIFTSILNSCNEYKEALQAYKQTGVWIRKQQ